MEIRKLLPLFMILGMIAPMLGALLDVSIYHFPFLLVLFFCGLIFIKTPSKNLFLARELVVAIVSLYLILGCQIITGRGFVILSGGGYVVLTTGFFYIVLCHSEIKIYELVNLYSGFYLVIIIFLLIEFLLLSFGYQPYLVKILSSGVSPGYKNYNPADFLQKIGLFAKTEYEREIGGLNSIFLGSQIAGMLSLFSLIWFTYVHKIYASHIKKIYSSKVILIICFFLLLITFNATVSLLTLISIYLYNNYIKKYNRIVKNIALLIMILVLSLLITEGILFKRIISDSFKMQGLEIEFYKNFDLYDRVINMSRLEYYAWTFFQPVELWMSRSYIDKFLGVGKLILLEERTYLSGDFGFGADVLFKCGLIWTVIFILFNFEIIFKAFKSCKVVDLNDLNWSSLGAISGLIAFLWLSSTIHYAQAFQNVGAIIFYSINIATALFCIRQKRRNECAG